MLCITLFVQEIDIGDQQEMLTTYVSHTKYKINISTISQDNCNEKL